jgi:beta-N-acetylhexosaminidase
MGAITKNYNMEEAAVKSVNAGSDIVLVCHEYDKQAAVINALKKAAENGIISAERINESVYRILSLKVKYNLVDEASGSVDVAGINKQIKDALNKYQ